MNHLPFDSTVGDPNPYRVHIAFLYHTVPFFAESGAFTVPLSCFTDKSVKRNEPVTLTVFLFHYLPHQKWIITVFFQFEREPHRTKNQ